MEHEFGGRPDATLRGRATSRTTALKRCSTGATGSPTAAASRRGSGADGLDAADRAAAWASSPARHVISAQLADRAEGLVLGAEVGELAAACVLPAERAVEALSSLTSRPVCISLVGRPHQESDASLTRLAPHSIRYKRDHVLVPGHVAADAE